MSSGIALTGTGVSVPPDAVTNEELCDAFNAWVRAENARRRDEPLLELSCPDFIRRVSGIEARHLVGAAGVLDPERLCPSIPDRAANELSVQAEMATTAARGALVSAGVTAEEVDLVIVGASSLQRPYPAIAIEVQQALGTHGYGFDISVGCSSGTFAIQLAMQAIQSGSARRALVCAPEVASGYCNFRDRDSHFILGDAAAAVLLERTEDVRSDGWEIIGSRSFSRFSSAVRNNGGFLNRCDPATRDADDKLFHQQGRRVFGDIVRLVPRLVGEALRAADLEVDDLARAWFHQANGRLNEAVSGRLFGADAGAGRAPMVMAQLANTAAAGALIAFHEHREDLPSGSVGALFAFGAGYTVGGQLLRRL